MPCVTEYLMAGRCVPTALAPLNDYRTSISWSCYPSCPPASRDIQTSYRGQQSCLGRSGFGDSANDLPEPMNDPVLRAMQSSQSAALVIRATISLASMFIDINRIPWPEDDAIGPWADSLLRSSPGCPREPGGVSFDSARSHRAHVKTAHIALPFGCHCGG
jgi:hypothetical protein